MTQRWELQEWKDWTLQEWKDWALQESWKCLALIAAAYAAANKSDFNIDAWYDICEYGFVCNKPHFRCNLTGRFRTMMLNLTSSVNTPVPKMSSGLHMTVAKFDTSMCGLEEMCDKLNDYINEHLKRFVFVFRGYINRAGSLVIVPCLSCAEAKQLLELVETARSELGVKESVFNVNHVSFGYPNSKDLVFNYEQSCRKTLSERSVFTKMHQANTRDSDTQNISKEVSNTEDSCMLKCMHSHRHAKR